ncbi:MAG: STAS domain-containing protein [Magnetococcales bacterium]|nr:STAS domain-containing protein [Magnetococcales bacterium]MBF0321876.1 STAS domain-containing protein [Magnetococcales bacterium]
MSIVAAQQGHTFVIQIAGELTYRLYGDFMRAVQTMHKDASSLVVDLVQTSHIDSAGMGMLLMMREMAGGDTARISLINASMKVRNALLMAQFQDLFRIT